MHSVAIVGGFGSGKTTVSTGLVAAGWTRVSFAGLLKEMAARAYGGEILKSGDYTLYDLETGNPRVVSGRRVLQELGQSVKAMDREFWISALLNDIDAGKYGPGPYVTDDCRFPYEAEALWSRGFEIVSLNVPLDVRIQRYYNEYGRYPTVDETHHPSEIELVNILVDRSVDGTLPPHEVFDIVHKYALED